MSTNYPFDTNPHETHVGRILIALIILMVLAMVAVVGIRKTYAPAYQPTITDEPHPSAIQSVISTLKAESTSASPSDISKTKTILEKNPSASQSDRQTVINQLRGAY